MIVKKYTIVQTSADVDALEQHLNGSVYVSFDTETTGLNVRRDKIIGFSVCGTPGVAFYVPLLTWDKIKNALVPVLDRDTFVRLLKLCSEKELLMWNGSYDVQITQNNFGINLLPQFCADVMLMKHTVDEEGDFQLKEVALSLQAEINLDPEDQANQEQLELKENVLANGGSWTKENKQMFMADLQVLGKYACADADLTLRLGEYFRGKLEQESLEEFFYEKEVMPLYREVTIPMEARGVFLDLPLINKTKAELEQDMFRLEGEIKAQLLATKEAQKWLLDRALADFPQKKSGAFAKAVIEKHNLPLPKTPAGAYSLTAKNLAKLPNSLYKSFLLGEAVLPEAEALEVSTELFRASGEGLNINSKHHLKAIVFDYMNIKPLSETKKGAPQFNDDIIQHLAEKYKFPWAEKLSNYNKLSKIHGTYIIRFLNEQENGKFYPSFFQHRTVSGRYGSDLQQLPRPKEEEELDPLVLQYNNRIREFFISGEGRLFVDDDYESLEPHTFAHVSGDDKIREIFHKGWDFYSTIAITAEKLTEYSPDKKADNYLGKLNKPKRQRAKPYALGIPYGMKEYALAKTLEIPTGEAAAIIDGYLTGFPDLAQWMIRSEEQAKYAGFVSSETGRIRHLPRVKELFTIHGDKLLDWRYRKKLSYSIDAKLVDSWYKDYKNGLNNAKNFQIQSLAASIVNMAAIEINREFRRLGIDALVLLQVHDQLVIDAPKEKAAECAEIVQRIMENNYKLSLKLKAPAAIGTNLRDAH